MEKRLQDQGYEEKMTIILEGLEGAVDGMKALMGGMEELAEELALMTEHYVKLAGCGDCGNWDPEKEDRVISARSKILEFEQVKEIFSTEIGSVVDEAAKAKSVLGSMFKGGSN